MEGRYFSAETFWHANNGQPQPLRRPLVQRGLILAGLVIFVKVAEIILLFL